MPKERERKGLDTGEHLDRPLDALLILSADLRARGAALCAADRRAMRPRRGLHIRAAARCADVLELRARGADRRARGRSA